MGEVDPETLLEWLQVGLSCIIDCLVVLRGQLGSPPKHQL